MERYSLCLKALTVITSIMLLSPAAVAQQCGTVGHTGTQANSARIENAFYINRGDPAGCDGTITSVSFCFYSSPAIGNAYSTTFAIYRHQGNNVYEVVPSTPREIRITHAQYQAVLGIGTFGCMSMNLVDPLMIQEGDVLGVCVVEVFNENGLVIRRLELAGSPAGDSGDLRTRNPVPNQCLTATTVPASVTTTGMSNNDVYLSANIEEAPQPPQQCGVGHTGTVANSVKVENAFYINRGDPATCDGTITSVSFCFYSARAVGNAYSTNFAIYRHQGNNVYEAVSTPREIRITHAQYLAVLGQNTFGCMSMNLAEPLMIQEGDVLGICVVEVFNENGLVIRRLELAGSPAGDSGDLRSRNPVPNQCLTANTVPVSVTTTGMSNNDVYLSANIVLLEEPTTQPPPQTQPTTQDPTTMEVTTPGQTTSPETTQPPTTTQPTTQDPTTMEVTTPGQTTSSETTQSPEDVTTMETTTQTPDNNPELEAVEVSATIGAAVSVPLLVIALGAIIITVVVMLMVFKVKRGKSTDNSFPNRQSETIQ